MCAVCLCLLLAPSFFLVVVVSLLSLPSSSKFFNSSIRSRSWPASTHTFFFSSRLSRAVSINLDSEHNLSIKLQNTRIKCLFSCIPLSFIEHVILFFIVAVVVCWSFSIFSCSCIHFRCSWSFWLRTIKSLIFLAISFALMFNSSKYFSIRSLFVASPEMEIRVCRVCFPFIHFIYSSLPNNSECHRWLTIISTNSFMRKAQYIQYS